MKPVKRSAPRAPAPGSRGSLLLPDHSVVIIGGSSGLGLAIAEAFAAEGASVLIAARRQKQLREARLQITRKYGTEPLIHPVDVCSLSSLQTLAAFARRRLGRVHTLVVTAGIHLKKPALKTRPGEWARVLETNLGGTLNANLVFGREMIRSGGGAIVNFSSLGARVALSDASAYCVSKSAVEMLTRCLALEWAPYQVRVNAILPGVFRTPLNSAALSDKKRLRRILTRTPSGRLGRLGEIAAAALYLASPGSGFATGSTVVVDGGFLAASGY